MKRLIPVLYAALAVGIVALILYVAVCVRDDVYRTRTDSGYEMLTDYEASWVEDASVPFGGRDEVLFTIRDISDGNYSLVFFTIHQSVEVYIGDELIYRVKPDEGNLFGKTPGNNWNTIPLLEEDAGKTMRIELIPAYENRIGMIPEFYLGSQFSIYKKVILENAVVFLLTLLAVVIGMVFIVFILYNYRNSEVDKSLLMLGIFSVNIGIWKFSDMEAAALLFPHSVLMADLPFLALMMVIVPFVLFVKELFTKKEGVIWDILCMVSLLTTAISLILQIFDVRDFRETLWVNHAVMAALIVVVLYRMVRELRMNGWNRRLKITAGCMAACLVGLAADIGVYYIFNGSTMMVMGMFGFLAYIIVLGALSLHDTKKLMAVGMQARRFEKMAFNDQLTGMYNRAAYVEYINAEDFSAKNRIVMMCDLNNLKKCNDTYGHEAGDRYLVQSAAVIQQIFGKIGRCFRMGGDEFCILLRDVSMDECNDRIRMLKETVAEYNKKNPEEFLIQIACGYEMFDPGLDYDISDTLRRADKMMYCEKLLMKQEKIPVG